MKYLYMKRLVAVSYTHLDVYKRQEIRRRAGVGADITQSIEATEMVRPLK